MKKPKMLMWSDFGLAGTGFGTVSRHFINSLHQEFEIDHLAINYNGEFFDKEKMPVQVSAAKLLNPQDPFGNQMFINAILTGKYDFIWIMNDTFVVEKVARELPKVFEAMKSKSLKIPKLVYYFPVDCQVLSRASTMLKIADHVVAYCEFGKEEALKTVSDIKHKLSVITHGVDLNSFRKISDTERALYRQEFFNVKDDKTFVWLNVNRNNARKNIAQTIHAFSEFKKKVPNSKLYLHSAMVDGNKEGQIDLSINVAHLGLELDKDVIFSKNYAAHKPYPIEILNGIYNASDAFITTSLGEGWGLTHLDAMLLDIPVLAPRNTCFPEQIETGNRGYLYDCKELVWIDNSGYRPMGRIEDITKQMFDVWVDKDIKSQALKEKLSNAKTYAKSLDWNTIGSQWKAVFEKVKTAQPVKTINLEKL